LLIKDEELMAAIIHTRAIEFRNYSRTSTTDLERKSEEDWRRIENLLGSAAYAIGWRRICYS
jgi:hypothetical protein